MVRLIDPSSVVHRRRRNAAVGQRDPATTLRAAFGRRYPSLSQRAAVGWWARHARALVKQRVAGSTAREDDRWPMRTAGYRLRLRVWRYGRIAATGGGVPQHHWSITASTYPDPQLMRDVFGTRQATAAAVALLVDVTRTDLAELRRCSRLGDRATAADRLHRMLGGLGALGRSPLIDDGRALLAALRTGHARADHAMLLKFAARLDALLERLDTRSNEEAATTTDGVQDREACEAARQRTPCSSTADHAPA
ncbi:hypothetical protein [Luteimonas salinilitoris]|uniref:HPt domain-containing protein n=1 Tax=Luteimonas salinilitoris TaxID=3237697 RepID=A0ABV4HRN9_9GAMM